MTTLVNKIEDLENKIRECQKKLVVLRELLKEDKMSDRSNPELQDQINKTKKYILYYQRELSRTYREKGNKDYPESIEYTEMYF